MIQINEYLTFKDRLYIINRMQTNNITTLALREECIDLNNALDIKLFLEDYKTDLKNHSGRLGRVYKKVEIMISALQRIENDKD